MDLIVGATGRLGGVLARQLLAEGRRVRVMTRVPERADDLVNCGAEVVVGDLTNPGSLAAACSGIDSVVASAHGFEVKDAAAIDAAGNRHLVEAAKGAGVRRLVLVSVLGASPQAPIDVSRAKYEAEQHLSSSGLEYVIVRAAPFMEFWATLIGEPVLQGRPVTVFGRGDNPVNFVSVHDVAQYVRFALDDPQAAGRLIEVGGPENLTLEEVVRTFELVAGRSVQRRHVPVALMRAFSVLLRPFNPMLARQLAAGAFMATGDLRFDPSAALATHPVRLTRLKDVALRLLGERSSPLAST